MDSQTLRLELDRWGRRVFVSTLLLLGILQSYVWLTKRDGLQPFAFGSTANISEADTGSGDSSLVPQIKLDRPVALLAGPVVCALDSKGKSVPLESLPGPKDLPVITGLTAEQRDELLVALKALEDLRRSQYALYGRLSELHYDKRAGWVAYLVQDALPVLLGQGNLEAGLELLAEALPSLEKLEDFSRIEFLDLRFPSQIVVRYRESRSS